MNVVHLLPANLTRVVFGGVRVTQAGLSRRAPIRHLERRRRVPGRAAVDSYVPVQGGPRIETLQTNNKSVVKTPHYFPLPNYLLKKKQQK